MKSFMTNGAWSCCTDFRLGIKGPAPWDGGILSRLSGSFQSKHFWINNHFLLWHVILIFSSCCEKKKQKGKCHRENGQMASDWSGLQYVCHGQTIFGFYYRKYLISWNQTPTKVTTTTDFTSYLVYSGKMDAWSLTSMSLTWYMMAYFQLSRTCVRFEQLLPFGLSVTSEHNFKLSFWLYENSFKFAYMSQWSIICAEGRLFQRRLNRFEIPLNVEFILHLHLISMRC